MKKKEKEHLKGDPLVHFVEKVIFYYKEKRRPILLGGIAAVALVVVIALFFIIRSSYWAKDNRTLSQALKIRNDTTLTQDEKVDRLKKLGTGKGVAAVTVIYSAQICYDNQEWQKALDTLRRYPGSRYGYLNDNKKLLEAEILRMLGKKPEAESLLHSMLADSRTELGKDFLLMKLAKMKLADGQTEAARSTLQQLLAEFPDSQLNGEAENLLSTLE